MVEEQIFHRGIRDARILESFRLVPRHYFVPKGSKGLAYYDTPLPIGCGQTISQPYVVALMLDALKTGVMDRVLEIGTGSGYAAALLSRLVAEVYSIERIEGLVKEAQKVVSALGYNNIEFRTGDGTKGWPEQAPFDGILVSAGAPGIPGVLIDQLAPGGRLIIPIGAKHQQEMVRIIRGQDGRVSEERLGAVRFVPLIGDEGW
jgi:protein-L-isoaspartate(D-aspartate) O-methyltransferase